MDESCNSEVSNLSEAKTKKAFEDRDWGALKSHLDEIDFSEATIEELLGHLRRSSGFILRYPSRKQELARDGFLGDLMEYLRRSKGDDAALRLAQEVSLLSSVERGYRSILALLGAADASALAPDVRVAAYLQHVVGAYADVMKRHDQAARALKQLVVPTNPIIKDESGRSISVDAAINALVTGLSTSFIMEARKNGWHDPGGIITLPALPTVSDDEVLKAGSTIALAMCWNRWQRTEQRRRFLGGNLELLSGANLPAGAPAEATEVTVYTPNEAEFFDYAANERVLDRLGQQFMEVMSETAAPDRVSGISDPVPLLPSGIVSLAEFHAAASLGDILKYEITDDIERPGGLRLLEWVRGYSVLQRLAEDSYKAEDSEAALIPVMSRGLLLSTLERCGLSAPSAEHFLRQVVLKISSDDLFDSPLIQLDDGNVMVFGPALLTANLTLVVLSTLATLQVSLSRRGRSLETALVALLQDRQLYARRFRVTRDGEEYEYDTVLVWGNYVFVFECKNRSLSSNHPVNVYHFELGVRSAIRQVKRLAAALRKHPDILTAEMNVTLDSKTIIPCVLNSLPYARSGDLEGVYCTDSSIVQRFFSERHLFIKSPYRVRKRTTLIHRVAIASLWKANKPSPEDFLQQLREPFQLKLLRAHTELRPGSFPIGPNHLVTSAEFVRKAWSVDSVTSAFGVSAAGVRRTFKTVRQQVRRAERRARTRRKQKGRRPK